MKLMNRSHRIIYRNQLGIITEIPNLEFAQQNPNYFENGVPTTPMEVNRLLVLNHGFTLIADEEKVICYKLL
ncbi:MAG TPA: hypothetical protein DC020_01240 [Flavobacterium sp.]|nr:MAG: hypothetical protein A2X07_05590 [Flavobacteria bacterium GWF1_32_7]HBD25442.1 hypothetical protein [Flavobacterium sp.]